ncbi:MAG TPA: rhomboid family intramembrane serine protease [Nannocystaceae bacterium]|nr:rhomboid family intramembrane serine protease [Nannocystaceae bacterium]
MSDRERRFLEVVQALVAEPVGAKLLGLGETGAALAMPDGSAAIVVTADHGTDEELALHWKMLVEKNPGHDLKLVLVGGGEAQRALLRAAQPTVMMRRVVQVFALGDDGTPWAGPRSRLESPMGRVLAELGKRAPTDVDRDALKATIPRVDPQDVARANEQRGFVETLRRGVPHVTIALLASYAIAFALEMLWGGSESVPTLVRMGANMPEQAWQQPWRLLSCAWLHAGPLHLALNGYALWVLGGFLERLLGWQRFLILYVLSVVGGSIATAVMGQAELSVGASGAICGLLGAAAALAWRPAGIIPPSVLPIVRRNALVNLALTVGISFLPQVDGMAHLGGALVGGLLVLSRALTHGVSTTEPQRARPVLGVCAIACAVVLVAGFATSVVRGRPWELAEPGAMVERQVGELHITVPEILAVQEIAATAGTRIVVFGDPLADPLVLQITIAEHGYDEDRRVREIAELADGPPAQLEDTPTIVGERRIVPTGGVPGLLERHRYADGIEAMVWKQLWPRHVVIGVAQWRPEHAKAEGVAEQAFASVRIDE